MALMVESFLNSSSLLANQGTMPQRIIASSRSPVLRRRRMTGWLMDRGHWGNLPPEFGVLLVGKVNVPGIPVPEEHQSRVAGRRDA
jgi:hypothetical protein